MALTSGPRFACSCSRERVGNMLKSLGADEVHGIGFLLADRLADQIGIRGDFPLRVQAGVLHMLREMADRSRVRSWLSRCGGVFATATSAAAAYAAALALGFEPLFFAAGGCAAGWVLSLGFAEETERAPVQALPERQSPARG